MLHWKDENTLELQALLTERYIGQTLTPRMVEQIQDEVDALMIERHRYALPVAKLRVVCGYAGISLKPKIGFRH